MKASASEHRQLGPIRGHGGVPEQIVAAAGNMHHAVDADRRDWFALLELEIRRAPVQGHLAGRDAHALAFQLDAIVAAANTGARMGDGAAIPTARSIVDSLLA
ncbi:UNVERIFIED_CONTAM: hypothetical protein DES50_11732 [Williamsia faeni]